MTADHLIHVALDQDLVQQLLFGLQKGAAAKSLKVVIGIDGKYHIDSKELRMCIDVEPNTAAIQFLHVHNSKQAAEITAADLSVMHLTDVGKDVVRELKAKYSPVFHSLADNIVVFGRAYGHD
jgi:CTP-dependent riboflavin kinase